MITVPACARCNQLAGPNDEDLRFYLSLQLGKGTPALAALWNEGARKSVKRKTSLRRQFFEGTFRVATGESDGVKERLAATVPSHLYTTVFARTVRGLYFHEFGRILTPSTPISVAPFSSSPRDNSLFEGLRYSESAAGAFRYWFNAAEEDADASVWILLLHEAHWTYATTGESAVDA